MNTTKKTNKFTRFLRNNAALLILIFCIIAIATVVLAVTLTRDTPDTPIIDNPVVVDPNPDDNKDPQPTIKDKIKVYFTAPVTHTSISMAYTDGKKDLFEYNTTLQCWAAHNGVDLVAADNTAVNAMYDGTVVEVTETFEMGNIVKIDHGDNVIATYASLNDVQVVKGQSVKKGDKIGTVSTTASDEFLDGAHLHLEVSKNGANVDPMPYVSGEIFREFDAD